MEWVIARWHVRICRVPVAASAGGTGPPEPAAQAWARRLARLHAQEHASRHRDQVHHWMMLHGKPAS